LDNTRLSRRHRHNGSVPYGKSHIVLRTLIRSQLQLVVTLLAIVLISPGALCLLFLLGWWTVTFWPIRLREGVLFCVAAAFFTGMNFVTLKQGIFSFSRPDILLMPYFELGMWGFYLLHTLRTVRGPVPRYSPLPTMILAILLCAAFAAIRTSSLLTIVSMAIVIGGITLYHDRYDLLYIGYMVYLGAVVEYTGVLTGLWSYPDEPVGGVPLWFISLWGGVGLLLRRLVLPFLDVTREPGAGQPS
jgi:hypothetical protein